MSEMIERIAKDVRHLIVQDMTPEELVRVVIERMRQPTPEMIASVPEHRPAPGRPAAQSIWRSMIDEILK